MDRTAAMSRGLLCAYARAYARAYAVPLQARRKRVARLVRLLLCAARLVVRLVRHDSPPTYPAGRRFRRRSLRVCRAAL
jgi:hypothetical protein